MLLRGCNLSPIDTGSLKMTAPYHVLAGPFCDSLPNYNIKEVFRVPAISLALPLGRHRATLVFFPCVKIMHGNCGSICERLALCTVCNVA